MKSRYEILKESFGVLPALLIIFFFIFGVGVFAYFALVSVHEYGHVWDMQRHGAGVQEVCLLGWRENVTSITRGGEAWAVSERGYDRTFAKLWDLDLSGEKK